MESSRPAETVTSARPSVRRHRRYLAAALLLVLAGFALATARMFVWPPQGMPARVDAIVMMNGSGDRLDTALSLAWAHRAPVIAIARGSRYWGQGTRCAPHIPGVRVICFDPRPSSTRGEAEFAGLLARRYRWQSITLVTTRPQDTRARFRLGRCFSGKIYVVTAPLPLPEWPWQIVHEWASTIKAQLFQRGC